MNPPAVFFDLDDTLLDDTGAQDVYLSALFVAWRPRLPHDQASFVAAWRVALHRHFERHLRGELTHVEQRRERIREVFQAPGLGDADADARIAEFMEAYEASWRLFDDVVPALDALAHRRLGVITNGLDGQQRQKLARTGIAERFAIVVTSDASKLSKPDPRIFHHAAAALGVEHAGCVHVGDDFVRDVEGAAAAGFRAIWLTRPGAQAAGGDGAPGRVGRVMRIESLLQLLGQV